LHYKDEYKSWLENELIDEITKEELRAIENDEKEIEDRFYKSLDFGTAGLRGIIGAGSNRMNKYTLSMAAQGFANYIKRVSGKEEGLKVVIAHDTRRLSKEFEIWCAEVMAANGIKAYMFDEIRSTPELSFAVNHLGCDGGAVITASHNPPEYNGFKVYGSDGCQLVDELADLVTEEVCKVTDVSMIKRVKLYDGLKSGMIEVLARDVDRAYMQAAKSSLQNLDVLLEMKDEVKAVYTPLHGTGGKPVTDMLKSIGFDNLILVDEQMVPDSDFTTAKSPNPEEMSAFDLGISYADKKGADIIIATDPDADRVGIAVRYADEATGEEKFRILSGNETGSLLLEYVATQYSLPEKPAVVSTIVTSDIARVICEANGIDFYQTLTGFKYIGEKIAQFKGELTDLYGSDLIGRNNFVMGYEESFGYLIGTHARDKDAVVTTALILEMYAFYKKQNVSLLGQLDNIYRKYGYYSEKMKSISLSGKEGMERIKEIMASLRKETRSEIGGYPVAHKVDYKNDDTGLRKADVVKYILECGSWFAVRPSGTEPKIKIYFSVADKTKESSSAKLGTIYDSVMKMVD
jgi:phosphoglucomutase